VVVFANLRFLEADVRTDILERRGLARVLVFRDRLPMLHRDSWTGKRCKRNPAAFAWFIWVRGYQGPPTFHRISANPQTGKPARRIEVANTMKETTMTKAKPSIVAESEAPPETVATASTAASPPPDPFDLSNLRLASNFAETSGVKKLLRTVPVRKPHKQEFIRVHPDPNYRENFAMIELKEDRETFLIAGAGLAAELAAEAINVTLFTAVNRQGVVFLWPVRLPSADGREMVWHSSAREAAAEAVTTWTRVSANMALGAYELAVAEGISSEPQWPDLSFQELLRIAFRDRLVTDLNHPVVKRLRGLA
jgi:hypothetical protein